MITTAPVLTNAGERLLTRAIGGEKIVFTRFAVGDGELSTTPEKELVNLISTKLSFGIGAVDHSEAGYISLTGQFSGSAIEEDFTLRELGLFAKGEDDEEILYCYANDGENAGIVKANQDDVAVEQHLTLVVAIGEAEHVTATLSPDTIYPLKSDFDAHLADDRNPHKVTKEQVGLGYVPNVSTNDQTPSYVSLSELSNLSSGEKLSTAFGKLSAAVYFLKNHIEDDDNPHQVSLEQVGAAAEDHTHTYDDIDPVEWTEMSLRSQDYITAVAGFEPKYRKVGDRVDIIGRITIDTTNYDFTQTGINIATMPTGYRPGSQQIFIPHFYEAGHGFYLSRLFVNTQGNFQYTRTEKTDGSLLYGVHTIQFNFSYFIN